MTPEGRLYRAIADPTRRALLDRLRGGEASAGDLASRFSASRPSISKHLRLLREARLVSERRQGRQRIYRLNPGPLADVDGWLAKYRVYWTARLQHLKAFVESSEEEP